MNREFINYIKENTDFQVSSKIEIEYRNQETEYAELKNKYHISKIAGNTDLEKCLNLLAWVNAHIRHKGDYDNSDKQDSLTLLGLAFNKDYRINCLAMSIILCECLLAVNVKARVMYMMPKNVEDGDSHVVVEAFVSDKNRWIMLDPTYGSYCLDSDKNILNLYELRNHIARDEEYYFSESINYNGTKIDDINDIKDYYAKNLFFLRCKSVQGYGQHREYGNIMEVAPIGFDVHKRMVENIKFRIKAYGDFEMFRIWMNYEESLDNRYIDITTIY